MVAKHSGATSTPINLEAFDVSPERGFLPAQDPIATLGSSWPPPLNELAGALPKLLAARELRAFIDNHPFTLPVNKGPVNVHDYQCAARILSFAGQGYVWEDAQHPAHQLPAHLAVAWQHVMKALGRPSVLSYASYALDNWRRLDPNKPIELGNIVLLQNFLGGLDEEWFVLVHVEIEAKAGRALAALVHAIECAHHNQPGDVTVHLEELATAEEHMGHTLLRMPERCDPYIYYHRVRPYIHGWKDNPALPHGLLYEGVAEFKGQPQHFRGETGAQSSIIPSLDAGLGVFHEDDPLRHYLTEMRDYMPPKHREFIAALERLKDASGRGLLYGYVRDRKQHHPKLWNAFRDCVHRLGRFRETHLDYADRYIHRQSQRTASNPTEVGTGGTPFMEYLKKHLEETDRMIAD
jgi:indoleamine 2,3-dioxygenase